MNKGFFAALCVILPVWPAPTQSPVSFLSEYIDFRIEGDYFSVNGIYLLANFNEKPVYAGIIFPFALPADMVDSIGVMNLTEARKIAFKKRQRDIFFSLSIGPRDSVAVHLYYRQPLVAKNVYVLSTTGTWGTPLEKAVYTLTTDKDLFIRSFSFSPDSSVTDTLYKTYFWNKTDFLPQADFEVNINSDDE